MVLPVGHAVNTLIGHLCGVAPAPPHIGLSFPPPTKNAGDAGDAGDYNKINNLAVPGSSPRTRFWGRFLPSVPEQRHPGDALGDS